MKHELGLVSVSFRDQTPEQILSAMNACGLSYIEWGSDVHCPPEKAAEIAELTKKYGIRSSSYGSYFRLGDSPIAELSSYIDAAKILGTKYIRVWCGSKNSEEYTAAEKEELFGVCREAATVAEEHGVVLCMECHGRTYTNTKEAACRLMQAVDSENFRMYWQPSQNRTEEENIASAKLLSPYVVNVHVFNWKGKEKYPLHEAVETWRAYLACLTEAEVLLLEFMPDGKIETLEAEAAALREIVG